MADIISRKMPYSLEAEQAILGSLLIDPEIFGDIAQIIHADDFYLEEHRDIYSAIHKLFTASRAIDLVTLIDTLVENGTYDREHGASYIKLLAEIVPSAANARDYAQIVHDKSLLRALISTCSELSEAAYGEQEEVRNILDMAESRVMALSEANIRGDFRPIREIIIETYDQIDATIKDKEGAAGTPSGFSGIDNLIVGMGKGDLVLIGARPGMGKTSFAMNVATNVARHDPKKAVCVFSLEMSSVQIVSRMLSTEALVDSYNLRSGKLSDEDWAKLAKASSFLSELNILIDDTPGITVTAMKAKLRRVKNLGLVVVDYLQLMQGEKHTDNRVLEVGDISRGLKLMAKELGVPIICCAQLSRASEKRDDKRPVMSDLRDSGAIEQDADMILFLYRDTSYDAEPEKLNEAEILVSKNRHGAMGSVKLGWYPKYTKFVTVDTTRTEN